MLRIWIAGVGLFAAGVLTAEISPWLSGALGLAGFGLGGLYWYSANPRVRRRGDNWLTRAVLGDMSASGHGGESGGGDTWGGDGGAGGDGGGGDGGGGGS